MQYLSSPRVYGAQRCAPWVYLLRDWRLVPMLGFVDRSQNQQTPAHQLEPCRV